MLGPPRVLNCRTGAQPAHGHGGFARYCLCSGVCVHSPSPQTAGARDEGTTMSKDNAATSQKPQQVLAGRVDLLQVGQRRPLLLAGQPD